MDCKNKANIQVAYNINNEYKYFYYCDNCHRKRGNYYIKWHIINFDINCYLDHKCGDQILYNSNLKNSTLIIST